MINKPLNIWEIKKQKTRPVLALSENSSEESFCMFINTPQLWASVSNKIAYSHSAFKKCVKKTGERQHSQTRECSVFTFSSYLNRRKMQIKCLSLLLFCKNVDRFPKLLFSYEVLNTHMYMDSRTFFRAKWYFTRVYAVKIKCNQYCFSLLNKILLVISELFYVNTSSVRSSPLRDTSIKKFQTSIDECNDIQSKLIPRHPNPWIKIHQF